jgi:hypothetical protein
MKYRRNRFPQPASYQCAAQPYPALLLAIFRTKPPGYSMICPVFENAGR